MTASYDRDVGADMKGIDEVVRQVGGNLLCIAVIAIICALSWRHVYLGFVSASAAEVHQFGNSILYSRTVIATNYMDDGFVRRGLGGSIAHLSSSDWKTSAALFTMFSGAWLSLPICVIVRRLARRVGMASASYLAAVICLSPQTFLGWSLDYSRTDMLAAGFVAWAAVLIQDRRIVAAAFCLLAGSLAHETTIIFGLPLVGVLARELRARGDLDDRALLTGLLVFLLGLAGLYACQAMLSAPRDVIASHMLSAAPNVASERMRDDQSMAVYMQVQGFQGVRDAMCLNMEEGHAYLFWSAMALLTLGAYRWVFPADRKLLLYSTAVIAPSLFLLLVANDIGRWTQLGVLNAWLLASSLMIVGDRTIASIRRICIGSMIMILLLLLGSSRYDRPFRLQRFPAAAAHLPKRELYTHLMDRCVPGWRSVALQVARR